MRLINTTTLQLEEYFDRKIPPYAILSHRWEEEEVTFQDMIAEGAANSFKITGCCQRAREDGLKYAWIDTCCIDKSSSAELSEAINSMFKWYKNAEVCYAYLSDVLINGFDSTSLSSMFRRSRWFTRGWTLQELLAPHTIIFFDITWTEIGTKLQLRPLIEQITGITHLLNFNRASIAQKMSWAAERVTTRVEDQAYCLMGLFGVNMPPLYGEGDNAFRRLQLEILEVSDDESIFAWKEDLLWDTAGYFLASHPIHFKGCSRIVPATYYHRSPYAMTNKGIRLDTFLLPASSGSGQVWTQLLSSQDKSDNGSAPELALLNCCQKGKNTSLDKPLAVYVRRASTHEDRYCRDGGAIPSFSSKRSGLVHIDPGVYNTATPAGAFRKIIYIKGYGKEDGDRRAHAIEFDFASALNTDS